MGRLDPSLIVEEYGSVLVETLDMVATTNLDMTDLLNKPKENKTKVNKKEGGVGMLGRARDISGKIMS